MIGEFSKSVKILNFNFAKCVECLVNVLKIYSALKCILSSEFSLITSER